MKHLLNYILEANNGTFGKVKDLFVKNSTTSVEITNAVKALNSNKSPENGVYCDDLLRDLTAVIQQDPNTFKKYVQNIQDFAKSISEKIAKNKEAHAVAESWSTIKDNKNLLGYFNQLAANLEQEYGWTNIGKALSTVINGIDSADDNFYKSIEYNLFNVIIYMMISLSTLAK